MAMLPSVMKQMRNLSSEQRVGGLRYCFGAGKEDSHVVFVEKGFRYVL